MPHKTVPIKMYDAVTPGNIPKSAEVVAGYIDGDYAYHRDDWNRWPDAIKVLITVSGSLTANVADVENGDMTPDQVPEWIHNKHSRGMRDCTVYCNRSTVDPVRAACHGRSYYIWVADWTGSAHAIDGTVATQYSNVDNAYDLSMVYSQEWLNILNHTNRPWPRDAFPAG
jgi:hypothetical protein